MSRLTDSPGADQYGLWTLDNARIVYSAVTASGATELFWRRSDAIGKPEQITDKAAGPLVPFPNAITPDSKQVIFRAATVGTAKNDLYIASISGGDGKARKLLATEHDEKNAALSPDGRYMAFESDLSGKLEVYVRPLPNVDDRQWTVSTAGGSKPLWAASGREIFYLAPDGKLMSVSVDPTRGLEMGKPVELFDTGLYFVGAVGRNYDVTRDGKRFVMIKNPASGAGGMAITVVVNWAEELKARLK
jgi:serine/threonine-protein kinase